MTERMQDYGKRLERMIEYQHGPEHTHNLPARLRCSVGIAWESKGNYKDVVARKERIFSLLLVPSSVMVPNDEPSIFCLKATIL